MFTQRQGLCGGLPRERFSPQTGCCRSDLAVECPRMPKPAAQGSLGQPAALIRYPRYPPFVPNFVDEW